MLQTVHKHFLNSKRFLKWLPDKARGVGGMNHCVTQYYASSQHRSLLLSVLVVSTSTSIETQSDATVDGEWQITVNKDLEQTENILPSSSLYSVPHLPFILAMPLIQSKPPDPFRPITDLIANISGMISGLPASIPEGKQDGKLYHVITNVMGVDEDVFSTFNRCFDILFGKDCRDNDGRLKNIEHRKYGMDAVCVYLKSIEWLANTPIEPVQIKLNCVLDEITYLVYVIGSDHITKLT